MARKAERLVEIETAIVRLNDMIVEAKSLGVVDSLPFDKRIAQLQGERRALVKEIADGKPE